MNILRQLFLPISLPTHIITPLFISFSLRWLSTKKSIVKNFHFVWEFLRYIHRKKYVPKKFNWFLIEVVRRRRGCNALVEVFVVVLFYFFLRRKRKISFFFFTYLPYLNIVREKNALFLSAAQKNFCVQWENNFWVSFSSHPWGWIRVHSWKISRRLLCATSYFF